MMFNKKIRKFIIPPVLVLLFFLSILILANTLIQRKSVQEYLISRIFQGSGLKIKTGKIEIDLLGPLGLSIEDFEALLNKTTGSIKAPRVNVVFDIRRMLKGEFYPSKINLIAPVIKINSGDNLSNFLKNSQEKHQFFLNKQGMKTLQIEKGQIFFEGHSTIKLNDLFLKLSRMDDKPRVVKMRSYGIFDYKEYDSFFKSRGEIIIDPAEMVNSNLDIVLETINTPAIWTPWSKYIEMRSGFYDSTLNIKGSLRDQLHTEGNIFFKDLNFIFTKRGRSHKYNINKLNCTLNTTIKDRLILVNSLNMKTRDMALDVNAVLDLKTKESPYLKLSVKSGFMPVDTFRDLYPFPTTKLWVEDDLFPLFENGNVKINALVLDGNFDQFRHLREEENRSVISMSFTCKDFRLSNRGIQAPFTDVSARVDIKNGSLIIPELKGKFGSSIIESASLHVNDLLSGLPYFKVFVDGDFDIKELLSHKEMDVIPETARDRINTFLGISGRLKGESTIGYRKDWVIPRLMNGNFYFKNCMYNRNFLSLPLIFRDLEFHINDQEDNDFHASGHLGDMPFSSSGLFEIKGSHLRLLTAHTNAQLDMNLVLDKIFKNKKVPFRFTNKLLWNISMEQQEDITRYNGQVDISNLVMESDGLFFTTAGAEKKLLFDLTSQPNGIIKLNSAQLTSNDSKITLSGQYNTHTKKPETLKIETESMSMGDLGLHFKGNNRALSGNLAGSIDIDFPDHDLNNLQMNGQIKGKDLSFYSGFLPLPVNQFDFRLDLAGQTGFIDDCRMKIGEDIVKLKGNLRGWKTIKGDFLLTSDFIDLTDFIAGKSTPDKKEKSSRKATTPFNPDINLKLNVSRGLWRKMELNHLIADLAFSGDRITIKNAQADLERGNLFVKGYVVKGDSPEIDISGDIELKEQPFDKLISDTGFGDKGIKGTLSANASLRIKQSPEKAFLKSMSGKLNNVSISKGLIKNSRVFIKILDFFNIPDKFKDRPPEMKGEGFYFERILGDAVIENGILKTDNFVMKSPAFNAVGSGQENLYEMTHNVRLLVQPIGNIDALIKRIPIVGQIFVEDDESFFRLGYDISGPWGNPDMDIVPVENLNGLLGVLKRAILTPITLLKKINNVAKSKKKPESKEEKQ